MTILNLKKKEVDLVVSNESYYDDKEFTLLNNIFKKIDTEKKELIIEGEKFKGLSNLKTDEEVIQYMMANDKRNSLDFFNEDYLAWSKVKEKDTKLLSFVSRVNNFVGRFFLGNPEAIGMPFYYYWTGIDKMRCASFHYPKTRPSTYTEHRNRLFVNTFGGRTARRKTSKYLAISIVIFAIFFTIAKPVVGIPYHFVHGIYVKHQKINGIETTLEKDISEVEAKALKAKSDNADNAKKIKAKYESGSISPELFNQAAIEIKNKDKSIDENKIKVIEELKQNAEKEIVDVKNQEVY